MKDGRHEDDGHARRGDRNAGLKAALPVSTVMGVVLPVAALLFVLWYAADVLLLVFAGDASVIEEAGASRCLHHGN